jgi:hypothetical protein
MNALGDAGTLCGHVAGVPDDLVRGGSIHTVSLGNPGKHVGNRLHPTPVLPQRLSQLGAEGHVAVPLAFALADMDQHQFFIDVAGFQLHQFSASHARGVEGHQHGAIQQVGGGLDEPGDFFRTQHRGQTKRDFGERDVLQHIGALERLHEEKTERGGALRHGVAGQFPHAKQVSLKLPDLFGTEFVRGAVKVLSEFPHCTEVRFCG